MTRYILAGGNDRATKSYWSNLAKVLPNQEPLRVLSCLFARPVDQWHELFDGFQEFFMIAFGSNMITQMAVPTQLVKQISKADVIYLHGGDTRKLKEYFKDIKNLEELFLGKIVIGSSAGSQFLGDYYWSCGVRKVGRGMGLVPVNPIVHFGSDFGHDDPRGPIDWKQAEKELQASIGPHQKITRVPEGEFVEYSVA